MSETETDSGATATVRSRHETEETTIRTRIEAARRNDPVFGLPHPVQGPILALLAVHPLAWAACWAGLLALNTGERLPLLSLTRDSLMQGSLFFAVALLAQCLLLLPPVLLTAAGAFWAWTLLALAGSLPMPPLP
jgi:hypothetical protein